MRTCDTRSPAHSSEDHGGPVPQQAAQTFSAEWYAARFETKLGRLVWRDERAALRRLLADVEGRPVLDAGVGEAHLTLHVASRGARATGADADVSMLRLASLGSSEARLGLQLVGVVEIVCGSLLLLGLLTRPAALVLIINMLVAIATTKVPILREWGFWAVAHDSATDWSMLLGSLFLLIAGAGAWSLDAWLRARLGGAAGLVPEWE